MTRLFVAWGHRARGGDASSVDLANLADAMCVITGYTCVARKHDGTAIFGGDETLPAGVTF